METCPGNEDGTERGRGHSEAILTVARLLDSTTGRRRSALLMRGGLIGVRPLFGTGGLVERFRRDVGPVRPHDCAAIHKNTLEVRRISERLEHRTVKPWLEVDRVFRSVVKHDVQLLASDVLRTHDGRQKLHYLPSYSGSILSSGRPASMFSRFASSSMRCCCAHSRIRHAETVRMPQRPERIISCHDPPRCHRHTGRRTRC